MSKIFWLFLSVNISCSSLSWQVAKEAPVQASHSENDMFRRSEKLYQEGYYTESLQQISQLEKQYATSVLSGDIWFLKGKNYLQEDRLEEAEKAFKAAYQVWENSPRGRAKSLYYLGICYERAAKDSQLIASLVELESMEGVLDEKIYAFDIPAKLAAAYSRESNFTLARDYAMKMDRYLKARVPYSSLDPQMADRIAQSLWEVGENPLHHQDANQSFDRGIKAIQIAQIYLMRSVEMNRDPWSQRALFSYTKFYDQQIQYLAGQWSGLADESDILLAREKQGQLREKFLSLSRSLLSLQENELPLGTLENSQLTKMFAVREFFLEEVAQYLRAKEVGSGLTKEAQALLQPKSKKAKVRPVQIYNEMSPKVIIKMGDPNL